MGVRAPGRAGPGRAGSLRDRGSGLCSSPQPPRAGRGAEGSKALTFEGDEAAAKQPLIVPVPPVWIPLVQPHLQESRLKGRSARARGQGTTGSSGLKCFPPCRDNGRRRADQKGSRWGKWGATGETGCYRSRQFMPIIIIRLR